MNEECARLRADLAAVIFAVMDVEFRPVPQGAGRFH